ncbi:MAG: tRNA (uridine(34)/cytosine(34)/5-carboxymethylaminomethyluridine(34)-2'-O)-methyltransferase TrmL [Clostridia bacterium]|nr:tRNA (uridine(34)/cytosine(34)/5-carboxymethylaminomethyluridine(34)-2'-O)-methyltransferase TrmL [Clostridia bacterium]MBQ2327244.1 tRNA (uridine(34)/cytosine(34)/5-carboxymethylaminomethyluridine(34)-2'-O)-methyltransferase TrmL [Clostridia bacterium]MBQ2690726.1 tRNA (uridine(34)/cytosine(34)/5-carboxymethylaminomethyluridine(34)-2'-O)-methyltransferase TrmL [Clostridia bacterium]MBQ3062846.1 tRNA (uridine(34)/cytosine(34)/5-carboxymethylaminomethyluridine(34)-2'-O)-methyltransferase TrmL 
MLNIVLFEPEIHFNTGNIARTCGATHTRLHLIKPFGFEITDKHLKRAGLDYWYLVDITQYENLEDFMERNPGARIHYASTKAPRRHTAAEFRDGDYIMFGKESRGLPESLLERNYDMCIRIPMVRDARSLNLSNSVAVVLYEALRQLDFPGLSEEGELTGLDDRQV